MVPPSEGASAGPRNAGCNQPCGRRIGASGDVILADLAQYLLVARWLKQDVSMHVFFDAAAAAFRFVLWSSALAPQFGSETRSPFGVLADASWPRVAS